MFYTRFSILSAAFLILLALLPWLIDSGAVRSVYLLSPITRAFSLAMISIIAAALVVQTFRVTICNSMGRFLDGGVYEFWERPPKWLWRLRPYSVWLIGLPLPVSAFWVTWQESDRFDASVAGVAGLQPWYALVYAALGVTAAVLLLSILDAVNRWMLTPNLHDPRMFVLSHRFFFGKRNDPKRWKRNRRSVPAKHRPVTRGRLQHLAKLVKVFQTLRLTHGYTHEIELWVANEDGSVVLEKHPVLFPGHVMLAMLTSTLIGIYIVSYILISYLRWYPDEDSHYGTLFYLVGLMMVLTGLLPAIAFCFDRYRIPALLIPTTLLVVITTQWPGTAPHYYETSPRIEDAGMNRFRRAPLSVPELVDGWSKRQSRIAAGDPPVRTLVVVTASGGGIQASAWTSRVLTGVSQADTPWKRRKLAGSISMISGVSGGSVATLQYVAKYPGLVQELGPDHQQVAQQIQAVSTRSSLEAVGWGLLFPDTMRVLGVNRNPYADRGQVQQQLWADRMAWPDDWRRASSDNPPRLLDEPEAGTPMLAYPDTWNLGNLGWAMERGALPAVIFNSFLVNTGQRVIISPLRLEDPDAKRSLHAPLEYSSRMSLELPLSTAARLSATFPYVSPTAVSDRPVDSITGLSRTEIVLRDGHFCDGGITDNEGLLAAAEFIRQAALLPADGRPFDRIVLLRIVPFPLVQRQSDLELGQRYDFRRDSNYLQSWFGPAMALYNGRSVAQLERGTGDIRQMIGPQVDPDRGGVPLHVVTADFRYPNNVDRTPPLSWKLSPQEKHDIELAWLDWSRQTVSDSNGRQQSQLDYLQRLILGDIDAGIDASAKMPIARVID
ncbi:MAG: hypothetical protein AAF958_09635 [Planctomycetota bacterium]